MQKMIKVSGFGKPCGDQKGKSLLDFDFQYEYKLLCDQNSCCCLSCFNYRGDCCHCTCNEMKRNRHQQPHKQVLPCCDDRDDGLPQVFELLVTMTIR